MTARRRLALAAVGAGLALPAAAPAQPAPDPPRAIGCKVDGYDVVLTNTGTDALPEGATIHWTMRLARSEGTHVLDRPLAPGRLIVLTGALGSSYLDAGLPCVAILGDP